MDNNENPIVALSQENSKLYKHNKVLSLQIAIAMEGLKAIVDNCIDLPLNIAQRTLDEIVNCEEEDLPQE